MILCDNKKDYRDQAIKAFLFQDNLALEKYSEILDVLKQSLPKILPRKRLYRYRSDQNFERTIDIIEKNEAYLCPLNKLNDPFEFSFNDDFGEIVKRVPMLQKGLSLEEFSIASNFQEAWQELCNKVDSYKGRMSTACFCEENDNILLWAHYANSNRGVCIEYSTDDLFEYFQYLLLPVIYQQNLPTLPIVNEIDELSPYKIALERVSTKSGIWCYENEWRIVKCLNPTDNHYERFPKPTAIYLGANASTDLVDKMIEDCVPRKILIYKMKPDKYSYSLSFEPLL